MSSFEPFSFYYFNFKTKIYFFQEFKIIIFIFIFPNNNTLFKKNRLKPEILSRFQFFNAFEA